MKKIVLIIGIISVVIGINFCKYEKNLHIDKDTPLMKAIEKDYIEIEQESGKYLNEIKDLLKKGDVNYVNKKGVFAISILFDGLLKCRDKENFENTVWNLFILNELISAGVDLKKIPPPSNLIKKFKECKIFNMRRKSDQTLLKILKYAQKNRYSKIKKVVNEFYYYTLNLHRKYVKNDYNSKGLDSSVDMHVVSYEYFDWERKRKEKREKIKDERERLKMVRYLKRRGHKIKNDIDKWDLSSLYDKVKTSSLSDL